MQRYWPTFESAFLCDLVDSLRRRSKAIKHRTGLFTCERLREVVDGESNEVADLYFELLADPQPYRICCKVWDDRWLWVDVRQASKQGWLFEWQHEGRVGEAGARRVAEAIEASFDTNFGLDSEQRRFRLEEIWQPVALEGPGSVV